MAYDGGEVGNKLSLRERADLGRLEAVVNDGMATFMEVGEAITQIRDRRLYRDDFATFEEYCSKKWNFTRGRAYQLITAYSVVKGMSSKKGTPPPSSEYQARALNQAEPEDRDAVWDRAVEECDGEPPPAEKIKEILGKVYASAYNPELVEQVRREEGLAKKRGKECDAAREKGTAAWHLGKARWHLKQLIRHLESAGSEVVEEVRGLDEEILEAHGDVKIRS